MHVKLYKRVSIYASKGTQMTSYNSPAFITYPHAHDVHDHALFLEHSFDMSDFGSAVTEQDRAAAEYRRAHPQLVQSAGHVATEAWERPGNDAVRMTGEL
jgi:hypothetical protein